MQRIAGISFTSDGPVRTGYLELAEVTILTGVNDSGKTRILRLIETALNDRLMGDWVDVFGIASDAEVEAFVDPEAAPWLGIEVMTDPLAEFGEALELPGLDGEARVGVRLPHDSRWDIRCAFAWGRSLDTLPDELADAVVDAIEHSAGPAEFTAPLKISYLGRPSRLMLPEPVVLPCAMQTVEAEIASAITMLCRALRDVSDERVGLDEPLAALAGSPDLAWVPSTGLAMECPLDSPRWLIDEDELITQVHPGALAACRASERIAGRLLPDFITELYTLRVVLAPLHAITAGSPVVLELERPVPWPPEYLEDDEELEDDIFRFALDEAASGFSLWLQLALRETAARLRTVAQILLGTTQQLAASAPSAAIDLEDPDLGSVEDLRDADEGADEEEKSNRTIELEARLQQALAWLLDPGMARPQLSPEPPQHIEGSGLFDDQEDELRAEWESVVRPRIYLIDEPEQRLHPALQRRAARWLSGAMSQWGSQCLLATHAIAFLDMPGDTRVYQVTRTGVDQGTVEPLDVATLTPDARIIRQLGLDRGELLSRSRAFLFVSDPDAATLLHLLFAQRLHASHITVLTIEPQAPDGGLVDLGVLAQFTSTSLFALLTSVPQVEIDRVAHHPSESDTERSERAGERALVRDMLHVVRHHHRLIDIRSLEAADVFDLLDPEAIRHTARSGMPSFPGHTAARRQHAGGKQPMSYRQFLLRTYGISTAPDAIRHIARQMLRTHTPPPPRLADLLWHVDQTLLETENLP